MIIHETNSDLKRESAVIQKVMRQFRCGAIKLPMHERLDFALTRNEGIVAFAEIKVRTFNIDRYPTVMVNLDKVASARLLTLHTNLPAFLFVQYTDALAYIDFQAEFEPRLGGRTDRNRPRDIGLMAHFNSQKFTRIEDGQIKSIGKSRRNYGRTR